MRPVNKQAGRVLDTLTAGLSRPGEDGSARRIDNSEAFMFVSVERIGLVTYSVAHYYEQNGDLVADPEMIFLAKNGRWFPVSFAMPGIGVHREGLVLDENENVTHIRVREQKDEAVFAGTWMKNIKQQQGI